MLEQIDLFNIDWVLLAQRGKVAAGGALLLLALFQWLAGPATIVGSALLWINEKTDEAGIWASIAAFVGGTWCGYGWFGWPFVTSTAKVLVSPGSIFSEPKYQQVTESSFSIPALLGNGVMGAIGFVVLLAIVGLIAPELFGQDGDESKDVVNL